MTDMAGALRKAGYPSSFERLINIAMDTWSHVKAHDWDGNLARHRYVRDRLAGEMTFEMMKEWHPTALNEAIKLLLQSANPKHQGSVVGFLPTGRGYNSRDTQLGAAPAISSPDPAKAGGEGHRVIGTQSTIAPAENDATPPAERRSEPANGDSTPRAVVPARPSLSTLSDKLAARTKANGIVMVRLSKLDEIKVLVGGIEKPLRKCTAGEVRAWAAWAKKQPMYAQFAERLVSNFDSNMVVGDIWKDRESEIEKIYAETEAEYAA